MARSHGPAIAAVILSAAFVGSEASAQIAGGPSPEVRARQDGPLSDGPYRDAPVSPDQNAEYGSGVVSVEFLRHPIPEKARRMLQRASETAKSGEHDAAIDQLREVLAKYPESAIHVHGLLGVEYLRTEQFAAAAVSFEQATLLLPNDAIIHHDFGLALVCAGNYQRGVEEVRRALELDPKNATMQALFATLLQFKPAMN